MNDAELRAHLSRVKLRATYPRMAVLTELSRSHTQPKSASELTATLSQFPRSTVYRSLAALEKTGLIKSSLIKWVRRYELGDTLMPHHHHITCVNCQKVNDFDSFKLERQLELAASEAGYQLISHVAELRGICSDCREEPEKLSAKEMLSLGIESMKKLRSKDSLLKKLESEDVYNPFFGDDLMGQQTDQSSNQQDPNE